MKKIFLLLLLLLLLYSCKTTTIVVVPIPNVEVPIYPPQTNLSYYNDKIHYNRNISNVFYFNSTLFSDIKNEFVYFK